MAKRIIYTAIYDGYDTLPNPANIIPGWQYVCFTNDPDLRSEVWEIHYLKKQLQYQDRMHKWRPHIHLGPHEESIWIDGNIDLYHVHHLLGKADLVVMDHPDKDLFTWEYEAMEHYNHPKAMEARRITEALIEDGMPPIPMVACGIMYRKNNKINEIFSRYMQAYVGRLGRDQPIFPYALWHSGIPYDTVPFLQHADIRPHALRKS